MDVFGYFPMIRNKPSCFFAFKRNCSFIPFKIVSYLINMCTVTHACKKIILLWLKKRLFCFTL